MSQNDNEKAVREFFKDPAVSQAVVEMVVRKKPMGWAKNSNAPYYKQAYGMAFKAVVDEMLKTRQDQVYFYEDFPSLSPSTLYQKIDSSRRYLLDRLDTEDRLYARWSEMVKITREPKVGVRISFLEDFREGKTADFKPRAVTQKPSQPVWKDKVDDYLGDPRKTQPFHIDGLCLTPDEIQTMRDSLKSVPQILAVVKSSEIKIIKTN